MAVVEQIAVSHELYAADQSTLATALPGDASLTPIVGYETSWRSDPPYEAGGSEAGAGCEEPGWTDAQPVDMTRAITIAPKRLSEVEILMVMFVQTLT
jgi:hypothetical protein